MLVGYDPSMSDNASTILREALALPADERARVAADLIASLDEEREDAAGVQTAWAQELERRARRALDAPARGQEWDQVRDRITERLTSE